MYLSYMEDDVRRLFALEETLGPTRTGAGVRDQMMCHPTGEGATPKRWRRSSVAVGRSPATPRWEAGPKAALVAVEQEIGDPALCRRRRTSASMTAISPCRGRRPHTSRAGCFGSIGLHGRSPSCDLEAATPLELGEVSAIIHVPAALCRIETRVSAKFSAEGRFCGPRTRG